MHSNIPILRYIMFDYIKLFYVILSQYRGNSDIRSFDMAASSQSRHILEE